MADQQVPGVVTQASPLLVRVDGADTASKGVALDGKTFVVGDRVTVTARNPRPPLVLGKES